MTEHAVEGIRLNPTFKDLPENRKCRQDFQVFIFQAIFHVKEITAWKELDSI